MVPSFAVVCAILCTAAAAATTTIPPTVSVTSAVYDSAIIGNPREVVLDNVTIDNALTMSGGGAPCRVTITNSRVRFIVVSGAGFPCTLNITSTTLGSASTDDSLSVLQPTAVTAVVALQDVSLTAKLAAVRAAGITGQWSLTDCNVTVPSNGRAQAGLLADAMTGGSLLLRRVMVSAAGSTARSVAGVKLGAAKQSTVHIEDTTIAVDSIGPGTGIELQGEDGTCMAIAGSTISARCVNCPTSTTRWTALDAARLVNSAALSIHNTTLTARANAATALRFGDLTGTPLVTVDNSTLTVDAAFGASGHLSAAAFMGAVRGGFVSVVNTTVTASHGACIAYPSAGAAPVPAGLMLRSNTFACNDVSVGSSAATPQTIATFVQCVDAVAESDKAGYGYGMWAPCADTASVLADIPNLNATEAAGLQRCALINATIAPFALPGTGLPASDVREALTCDGGRYGAVTLSASATITGCVLDSLTLTAPTTGSISVTLVGSSVRQQLSTDGLVGNLTVRRCRIGSPWAQIAMSATVQNRSTVVVEDTTIASRTRAVHFTTISGHLHLVRTVVSARGPDDSAFAMYGGDISGTLQLGRVTVLATATGEETHVKGIHVGDITGTLRASLLDATATALSGPAITLRFTLQGGCATFDGIRAAAKSHRQTTSGWTACRALSMPSLSKGGTLALIGRPSEGYASIIGQNTGPGSSRVETFNPYNIEGIALTVSNLAVNATTQGTQNNDAFYVGRSTGSTLAFTNVSFFAPGQWCMYFGSNTGSSLLLRGVEFTDCGVVIRSYSIPTTQVCLRNASGLTDIPVYSAAVVTPCTPGATDTMVAAPTLSYQSLSVCAAAASVAPYRPYGVQTVTGTYTAQNVAIGHLFIVDPTSVAFTNVTIASVSVRRTTPTGTARVMLARCTVANGIAVSGVATNLSIMIEGSSVGTERPRVGIDVEPTLDSSTLTLTDSTVKATVWGVSLGGDIKQSTVALHNSNVIVRSPGASDGIRVVQDLASSGHLLVNRSTVRVEESSVGATSISIGDEIKGTSSLSVLHSQVTVLSTTSATAITVADDIEGCLRVEDSRVTAACRSPSLCSSTAYVGLYAEMYGLSSRAASANIARNTITGSNAAALNLIRSEDSSTTITDNVLTSTGENSYALDVGYTRDTVVIIGNNTMTFSEYGLEVGRGGYDNTILFTSNRMRTVPDSGVTSKYFSLSTRSTLYHGCNVDRNGGAIAGSAIYRGRRTSDCSVPRTSACGMNSAAIARFSIGADWKTRSSSGSGSSGASLAWIAAPVIGGVVIIAVGCLAFYYSTQNNTTTTAAPAGGGTHANPHVNTMINVRPQRDEEAAHAQQLAAEMEMNAMNNLNNPSNGLHHPNNASGGAAYPPPAWNADPYGAAAANQPPPYPPTHGAYPAPPPAAAGFPGAGPPTALPMEANNPWGQAVTGAPLPVPGATCSAAPVPKGL